MKYTALMATLFLSTATLAEVHTVTVHGTTFSPTVIQIAPGDRLAFTNMAGHTTTTIDKYSPADTESYASSHWKSTMSTNYVTDPINVEGIYFVKCEPHWGMGMGMGIIVGEPTNLANIKALKPKGSAKRLLKKVKKLIAKK